MTGVGKYWSTSQWTYGNIRSVYRTEKLEIPTRTDSGIPHTLQLRMFRACGTNCGNASHETIMLWQAAGMDDMMR